MLATYSGDFRRPSILRGSDAGADELRQHVEAGEVLRAQQVLAVAEVDFSPSRTSSYGMRQAWAHSPRLAERPPSDSLVRHWPE